MLRTRGGGRRYLYSRSFTISEDLPAPTFLHAPERESARDGDGVTIGPRLRPATTSPADRPSGQDAARDGRDDGVSSTVAVDSLTASVARLNGAAGARSGAFRHPSLDWDEWQAWDGDAMSADLLKERPFKSDDESSDESAVIPEIESPHTQLQPSGADAARLPVNPAFYVEKAPSVPLSQYPTVGTVSKAGRTDARERERAAPRRSNARRRQHWRCAQAMMTAFVSKVTSNPTTPGEVILGKVLDALGLQPHIVPLNIALYQQPQGWPHDTPRAAQHRVSDDNRAAIAAIVHACSVASTIPIRAATRLKAFVKADIEASRQPDSSASPQPSNAMLSRTLLQGKGWTFLYSLSKLSAAAKGKRNSGLVPDVRKRIAWCCTHPITFRMLLHSAHEVMSAQILSSCLKLAQVQAPDRLEDVLRCVRQLLGVNIAADQALDDSSTLQAYCNALQQVMPICRDPKHAWRLVEELTEYGASVFDEQVQQRAAGRAISTLSDPNALVEVARCALDRGILDAGSACTVLNKLAYANTQVSKPEHSARAEMVARLAELLTDTFWKLGRQSTVNQMNEIVGYSAWALNKVGYRSREFADGLLHALEQLWEPRRQELTLVLWALAARRHRDKDRLNRVVDLVMPQIGVCRLDEITASMWAVGELQLPRKDFLDASLAEILTRLDREACAPEAAANVLQAFAKLNLKPSEQSAMVLVDHVLPQLEKRRELRTEAVSRMVAALTKMGYQHSGLTLFALRAMLAAVRSRASGDDQRKVWNVTAIGQVVHAASRLRATAVAAECTSHDMAAVLAALLPGFGRTGSSTVACTLWAVVRMGAVIECDVAQGVRALFDELLAPSPASGGGKCFAAMNPWEASLVAFSLGCVRVPVTHDEYAVLLDAFRPAFGQDRVWYLSIVNFVKAMNMLDCYDGATLDAAFAWFKARLPDEESAKEAGALASLVLIVGVAAQLRHRYDDREMTWLADTIVARLERGQALPLTAVANFIDACATVNFRHRGVLEALTAYLAGTQCNVAPKTASVVLQSLAEQNFAHPALEQLLLQRLLKHDALGDAVVSALYYTQLIWRAHGREDWSLPPSLLRIGKLAWRDMARDVTASKLQERVFRFLQSVGCPVALETFTADGDLSVDIAMSYDGRPVALEVDGPHHYARNSEHELGRTTTRRRLLTHRGWTVVNINHRRLDECPTFDAELEYLSALFRDAGLPAALFLPLARR